MQVHAAIATTVVGDGRIGNGAHHIIGPSDSRRWHTVQWSTYLRARTGEITVNVRAFDSHRSLNGNTPVQVHAVVVEVVGKRIRSIGDCAESGARHRLSPVHEFF